MEAKSTSSTLLAIVLSWRVKFCTASTAPVLVGTALAYAYANSFSWRLFAVVWLAMTALHIGANLANDYFDHLSGNDDVNRVPTPFSGGSRTIQDGRMSARSVLLFSIASLAAGAALGIILVCQTGSVFILGLGIAGLLGGWFYTAPPLKLGYRCAGEISIALLFGLLPVFGAYYVQSGSLDGVIILPACIPSVLIFLIILINEFPDSQADAAVNKNTLVVALGRPRALRIYRAALVITFVLAAAMLANPVTFYAGLFYIFTLPLGVLAYRFANVREVSDLVKLRSNKVTVALHFTGSLAVAAGLITGGLLAQ